MRASVIDFLPLNPYDPHTCVAGAIHEFVGSVKDMSHPLVNLNFMVSSLKNTFGQYMYWPYA